MTTGIATNLLFPDQSFDLLISLLFLHQLSASLIPAVINEALRVIDRDGTILFDDFHPEPIGSIHGKRIQFIISSVEFFAGWDHYNNLRDFISPARCSNFSIEEWIKSG